MTTRIFRASLICSAVAAACATLPSHVQAQDNDAKELEKVERITVTSRKREETILEIPMSVSSISSTEILDRNYTDASDIYRTLAGAAAPRGELILRGLSGGNSAAPGTTATFTDDIPFAFTNLSDVERVEILRGPQGTLYGSNAIGGTVRVITNKPRMDEFELFGSVQASSENNVEGYDNDMSLGLNLPLISDKLAMRVNGNLYNDVGPFVNTYTGNQRKSSGNFIRTQFLYKPTEEMDINFSYVRDEYQSEGTTLGDRSKPGYKWVADLTADDSQPYGYAVDFHKETCDENLERSACNLGGQSYVNVSDKYAVYDLIDGSYHSQTDLFALTIDYDNILDIASLTYAGSYR